MTKILVTGATGGLGGAIAAQLVKLMPANDVVALARDPIKAKDLTTLGIEVRRGDYFDRKSLARAFTRIDKLMFVSTITFTDGLTQHRNVVHAATDAGVGHVYYTAIQQPTSSQFVIPQVRELDRETEKLLAHTGVAVTILRNTIYLDALPLMLSPRALEEGVRAPAGNGRAALAARHELAEAAAILLAANGHAGQTYTLGGSLTTSMAEVAAVLTKIAGKEIAYVDLSVETFISERQTDGLPSFVPRFPAAWFTAIKLGEFAEITYDLERILGRPPLTAEQFLPSLFTPHPTAH